MKNVKSAKAAKASRLLLTAVWSLLCVIGAGIGADGQDIHGHAGAGTHANAVETQTGATDQWMKSEIQALHVAGAPAEQQKVVRELVLKLGPEKAQDELLHSGLPFTGDSHLVIHTVGTTVYEKHGLEGITHCRPYFLGACYHGFLIEVIGKRGPQVISDVWAQCKSAGPAIMPQCAHAVGHGLLAWRNNSIRDALAACDSLAADVDHFVPLNCYDGVFMENIWGHHDHEHGAAQPGIVNDLEYPCSDPQLKAQYLPACWGNQVSFLYRAFRGNLAKIGEKCFGLAESEIQESCFNGLARQIQPLTQGNANEAFRLCTNAVAAQWRNYCLAVIAEADFSMGDQSIAPFEICGRIDADGRKDCYSRLISVIALYAGQDANRIAELCARISDSQYVDDCTNHFGQVLRDEVAHRVAGGQQNAGEISLGGSKDPVPQARDGRTAYVVPYPVPYMSPYPYPHPYPEPYQYPAPYQHPYQTPPTPK